MMLTLALPHDWHGSVLMLVVATILSWGGLRRLTGKRALDYERRKRRPSIPAAPVDTTGAALLRLDGPDAVTVGTDGAGRIVRLKGEVARRSAIVLGAPGSGKTRWLLGVLKALIVAMATGLAFDLHVVDPKNETVDLLRQIIGGWLLTWPEERREWLRRHVRVVLFSRDRVTPLRPYDNVGRPFTDAYTASFRTAVTVDAASGDYTDGTRFARGMYDRVLTDLRWPLNAQVTVRFFTDPSFQALVASRVRDGHLRAYIHTMGVTVPKATGIAVARRVEREMSDPHIRAAKGTPPAALDTILPATEPGLVLSRVGSDSTLTPTAAQEICLGQYLDLLASVTTRSQDRPLLIAAEELAATVAGSPRLVTPIAQALRTSRSFGVSLWALAQDFENAAQTEMAKTFALNARFVVAFQSRDEAAWLAPHVPIEFAPGASDAERKRSFLREMEGLPPRSFFLWVKGEPVVRCQALETPDPATEFGRSPHDLLEVFDREISVRSTITLEKAEELIGQFESQVLGSRDVAPAPEAKSAPQFSSVDEVLRYLDRDEEDADA